MRQAMGVAVFSGMIGVTVFGLFLTPVFYVEIMKRGGGRLPSRPRCWSSGLHLRGLDRRSRDWVALKQAESACFIGF
jgi:hypothetical protein